MAKGAIVVSLRSKGLPSYSKSLLLDVRYHAVQLTTELLDIFLAALVSLACLSWSSWIAIAIAIASIAGMQGSSSLNGASRSLDVFIVFVAYVVLPLIALVAIVFGRRERAMRALADLKASFVTLLLHRPSVGGGGQGSGGGGGGTAAQRAASEDLHRRAVAFVEDLRQYLQHRRPYARHFYVPYRTAEPSPNDELLRVSRELGMLQRKVHRGVRAMHLACARARDAGMAEGQVSFLVGEVKAIHAATERLINIKEARTPVVLRSVVRWFMVVVIPVTMGTFWTRSKVDSAAFAGILGVLSQIALMSLVDAAVALEDPFDDTALDAISTYELIDQVGVMTAADGGDGGGPDAEDHLQPREPASGGGGEGGGRTAYETIERTAGAHVGVYMGEAPAGNGSGAAGGSAPAEAAGGAPADSAAAVTGGGATAGSAAAVPPAPDMASGNGAAASGGGGAAAEVPTDSVGSSSDEPGPLPPPSYLRRHHELGGGAGGGGGGAMASSVATSQTAVGPPSYAETSLGPTSYTGGNTYAGGTASLPSVGSSMAAALPGVGPALRAPLAMPPMPALAGHGMYRSGAGAGAAAMRRGA
ncbi:hypothetical protein GPECTOR_55g314 [Gonium pectorale]|uniref:Uncharacterized protein n=1 Tax=Gonium pectorale TaxID=33097 RepID=A0A150G6F4_GONPE|nr:hypothetical protein GPECTOR_55g314 [Gonium pectorale]|eukprot:KXZ45408.1 hypothetical protein GPECTOR_55g314 [Gonium pectorale]